MPDTELSKLVDEYLRLGGQRKAAVDDNKISTRVWENEPAEAREFWEANIASLPEDKRKEAETLLPSITEV